MTTVANISPHLTGIDAPSALRDLQGWLIWRFEYEPGVEKPRKVPYYANGGKRHGRQGDTKDVAGLVTFAAARRAAARRGFDGVGLALLPQFGVTALDFDNCVTGGKIHPEVEGLLLDTYAEYSPSGRGVRAFFMGALPDGKDLRSDTYSMEVFSAKGFVTFTGQPLEIVELMGNTDQVAPLTDAVREVHTRRFSRQYTATQDTSDVPPIGITRSQLEEMLSRIDPDCPHDDWLHVGMGLHHELGPDGLTIWDEWSSRGSKYPGRDKLAERWASFGRYAGPPVTLRTALKLAGMSVSGPADPEEFAEAVEKSEPQAERARFQFEPVHTFSSATALPWIIKGVLPKASLAVVYGASGSGKSFAVLDMSMAIARGVEWRGRRVRQGRVAYIAAEGADGFRKRVAAYAQHHGVDLSQVPLVVLNAAPNLMEKQDAVDLARGVKAAGGADVIVVDTFAQTTPGANENAGEDVGKALGYCKRIHEVTGALVLLIHHSGKDATKGARGWSGLRAAADAEIEVVREATGRYLRLSKNKDGEDGLEWGFDLEVVQLGVDEDLDPITSCVVVEAEMPVKGGVPNRRLGPVEAVVNAVIQEMAQSQTEGIEVGPVIAEAVKRMEPPADGKRDSRRQRVKRALEALCNGDEAPYGLGSDGCIFVC